MRNNFLPSATSYRPQSDDQPADSLMFGGPNFLHGYYIPVTSFGADAFSPLNIENFKKGGVTRVVTITMITTAEKVLAEITG